MSPSVQNVFSNFGFRGGGGGCAAQRPSTLGCARAHVIPPC